MSDEGRPEGPTDRSGNAEQGPAQAARAKAERANAYWQANIRVVLLLLCVWAAVSYGGGVLFAEQLNAFKLPGSSFPLGFWFAQQGSIVTFVFLIAIYAVLMGRLDRRFELASRGGDA